MDAILAGGGWNAGWLLPAGAALIALGLTAIGAALWQLVLRRPTTKTNGINLDIPDSSTPPVVPAAPVTTTEDPGMLRQLDARIMELEELFEEVARRSLAASNQPRRPRVGLRFAGGEKPAESSETRALAALAAGER